MKISPSLSEAALARLSQGTKVLADGGYDKVFQQAFQNWAGEKLLHSYACYLSTTSGPVIGMLYITNKRIAFRSDFPLSNYSSPGNPEWFYYKVYLTHPLSYFFNNARDTGRALSWSPRIRPDFFLRVVVLNIIGCV